MTVSSHNSSDGLAHPIRQNSSPLAASLPLADQHKSETDNCYFDRMR